MEEWKIYRLGDLVDFQNGYAFKSSKFLYDGKYKIIRIKELKNGLVKFFEDTVSISDEPNEILSKILVNKGDVIFAFVGLDRTGRFGPYAGLDQLAFVGFEDEPFIDDIVQLSAFDALAETKKKRM